MSKPSISGLVAASVVFSTTLLVVAQQSATVNPLAGNPAAIQAGGKLFDRKCAKCHGPEGQGDPNDAPPLNTMSFIHGREDAEVFHTIRLAEAGVLAPYESPAAKDVPDKFKDAKQHRWAGTGLGASISPLRSRYTCSLRS